MYDEKDIRAIGADLAEAYVRLDQAEAALYAYYHARLEQTRQGGRMAEAVDESPPLRQVVKAAYETVLSLHTALGETRKARLRARTAEQVETAETP